MHSYRAGPIEEKPAYKSKISIDMMEPPSSNHTMLFLSKFVCLGPSANQQ